MEHRDGSSRFPAYISVSFFSRPGVRVTDESRRGLLLPRAFITRRARAVRVGRLDGRVALVTGGSGGIGKASVLEFATEGADVAVQFKRGKEAAHAVVEKVQSLGRKAVALPADVADPRSCQALVSQAIATFRRIDIAACFAGHPFRETEW